MLRCDFSKVALSCSHHRCSIEIVDILKNFTKFTGKHLCQSLFFSKVAGLRQPTEHLGTTASMYLKGNKGKWVQQSTGVVIFRISSNFSVRVINNSIFSFNTTDSIVLVQASSAAKF